MLLKAERDHLVALIREQSGGWAPTPTGGAGFLGPASSSKFQASMRRDPVVARLEARIANATGIMPHPHEDILRCVFSAACTAAWPKSISAAVLLCAFITVLSPVWLGCMSSVAKIKTRGNQIRGGYYTPFGLHHETDGRPYRAATVLVYLKAPKEGGRTVFPLCSPPSAAADPTTLTGQVLVAASCTLPSPSHSHQTVFTKWR